MYNNYSCKTIHYSPGAKIMITLLTNTVKVYLHDDGTIQDAPEGGALFGDIDGNVLFNSLDDFLASNVVTSIISEDGYKFAVTDDGVTDGDMSFDSLQSAIEALQS
jgi:hypothetical protein